MKEKITLLLLLFSLSLFAQKEYSTNYEIEYKVEYSIDSTDLEDKSIESTYLYTNSEESVFMSYPKAFEKEIKADLLHQLKTKNQLNIPKEASSNFKKVFYKNLSSGKVLTVESIATKNYFFQEDKLPLEWEISTETKEILGYQAQKAKTNFAGRNFTAWFTLEIPISDGPYLFSGLPGLIIELYDEEKHYSFSLKNIDKLKEERVFKFPKAEEITKTEFLKLQKKAEKNSKHDTTDLPGFQMKVVTTDDMSQEEKADNQAMKRRIKENKLRKNNPIERE